jgi:hypothetical protein
MSSGEGSARFRLPSINLWSAPAWAAVAGGLVVLFSVAMVPLTILAGGNSSGEVVTALVVGLPAGAVGMVVARRQPRNPLGWLLLAVTACLVLSTDGPLYALLDYRIHNGRLPLGPVAILLNGLWGTGLILFGLVILLFPDGKLLSAPWRWALRVAVVVFVFQFVAQGEATVSAMVGHRIRIDAYGGLSAMDHPGGWYGAIQGPLFLAVGVLWLCSVGRQVVSWRRSSGERRQQLKWLMSGAAVTLACAAVTFGATGALSGAVGFWRVLANFGWFGFAALPVSIGVAILKYRLYEIDRLISRTLAYAIVTGLLVGVYAGLVLLTTRVLTVSSPVAVAASTLAAAALFSPVRRRVQRAVDRRFNRARYDADKTVAAFAARLTGAVDLDTVRTDLAGVVSDALEPAYVSVWVAKTTS